eukprot:scaffold27141_cov56-Attheya_sp.AAC.2
MAHIASIDSTLSVGYFVAVSDDDLSSSSKNKCQQMRHHHIYKSPERCVVSWRINPSEKPILCLPRFPPHTFSPKFWTEVQQNVQLHFYLLATQEWIFLRSAQLSFIAAMSIDLSMIPL